MKGRGFSKTVREAGKTYVAELREVEGGADREYTNHYRGDVVHYCWGEFS